MAGVRLRLFQLLLRPFYLKPTTLKTRIGSAVTKLLLDPKFQKSGSKTGLPCNCPNSSKSCLPVSGWQHISIWDSLACLALGPHRPSCFTCPVRTTSHPSHMSHLLQRDLSCLWCSGFFGVWCLWFFGLFAWGLFGLFLVLFLVSLCFLHALALSLTGAQRTDSSFASKKNSQWLAARL